MHRRRLVALATVLVLMAVTALVVANWAPWRSARASPVGYRHSSREVPRGTRQASTTAPARAATAPPAHRVPASGPFAVGVFTANFVDPSRLVYPPHSPTGQPTPRTIVTSIYYPAVGSPQAGQLEGAPADAAGGPYPLVVFGPGFEETPQPYEPLLDAWARAGYVVAALTFPVTNPEAPGGPDENDIVNQPADMSFVISQLASGVGTGPVQGLIDDSRIAVAGQSDGAETAAAVAYDSCCKDPRISAAVILAGQEMGVGTYFASGGPPMLAAQGTADDINPPSNTYQLFDPAPQPKYLLTLLGADHIGPFSNDPTFEPVVASVTTDFLDAYLKSDPSAIARMGAAAGPPSVATLQS